MEQEPWNWDVEWNPKIEARFMDLVENERFQDSVREFRQAAGIPAEGTKESIEEGLPLSDKEGRKKLDLLARSTDSILRRFKYDKKVFEIPVRTYLYSGQILVSPYQSMHAELKFGDDSMNIVIYPGATKKKSETRFITGGIWLNGDLK